MERREKKGVHGSHTAGWRLNGMIVRWVEGGEWKMEDGEWKTKKEERE